MSIDALSFEQTNLWLKSLGDEAGYGHSRERERLRTELRSFRGRVSVLVERISSDLPELTIHDVTHLDALWEMASLLTGETYPLNPLEAFILGGAILLHDAALCFEAYEGGLAGVRETVEWKDAYAAISDGQVDEQAQSHLADFQALRLLHASQAADLCTREWKHNGTSGHFLVSDTHLRTHLGELIGQIAASHHWSIEEVQTKLPRFVNSPSEFPSAWRVCPQKIACILRCADAMHIDGRRAPDFLYALIGRSGISLSHWKAQNWIGRPSMDPFDCGQLLITSTRAFTEKDFEAWWVAYDAARLIDREIQASNQILNDMKVGEAPAFQCKGVSGVASPGKMVEYFRVSGWQPCNAELHVGNVESLVKNLGGEQLYGNTDKLWIVIRELIQNARDAIAARQALDNGYAGAITIRVNAGACQEIDVEDDGIGMSERVLTSVLLDFGSSFWSTEIVRSEFPGLRASSYRPVGRFGIGFYSTFMIANSVSVVSRRWDKGLDECRELKFKDHLSLRPLMCTGRVPGFTSSTKITLKLKDALLPEDLRFKVQLPRMGESEFFVPLESMLRRLVAGLDVKVRLSVSGGVPELIHSGIPSDNAEEWHHKISFSEFCTSKEGVGEISKYIKRMRPIMVGSRQIGLAALSAMGLHSRFFSLFTVGGLATNPSAAGQDSFIGYIDCPPLTARRNHVALADHPNRKEILDWASEQIELMVRDGLNPFEECFLPHSLAEFGFDSFSIGKILISTGNNQRTIVKINEISQLLRHMPLAFLTSDIPNHVDSHNRVLSIPGYALYTPVKNSAFNSLEFDGDVPTKECSLAYQLHKVLLSENLSPKWGTLDNVGENMFGSQLNAMTLSI